MDDRDASSPILWTDLESRPRLATVSKALFGPPGTWRVDDVAPMVPWRHGDEVPTEGFVIWVARLAVWRAWDAGRTAEGRRRGRRETVLNLRRGDPLLRGARLPDIIEQARQENGDLPVKLALVSDIVAARLGVALEGEAEDAARLRAAAAGTRHQGRDRSVELPAFVRSLAVWWHRNTGRRPERRVNDARKSSARATFFDFAIAAAIDVSRSGKSEPEGIRSVIRREIEALEQSGGAPWNKR